MNYLRAMYEMHRAQIKANPWRGILRLIVIMVCGWGIILTGAFSSFFVFRRNFDDMPGPLAIGLGVTAVAIMTASFFWFLCASFNALFSRAEKFIAYLGAYIMFLIMLCNSITGLMIMAGQPLGYVQLFWLRWGADIVFLTVLVFVLILTLSDPIVRLIKLEYRSLRARNATKDRPRLLVTIKGWWMLACLWWLTALSAICLYQAAIDLTVGRFKTAATAILFVVVVAVGFRMFCLRKEVRA